MMITTDASTKGWGAVCKGTQTGGDGVPAKPINYQIFGAESCVSSDSGFCQGRNSNAKTFETVDRQHNGGGVYQQKRGHTVCPTSITSDGDLDVLPNTPDMAYSKTSPKLDEFRGGLCVQELQHTHRMDAGPKLDPNIFWRITTRYYTPEVDFLRHG